MKGNICDRCGNFYKYNRSKMTLSDGSKEWAAGAAIIGGKGHVVKKELCDDCQKQFQMWFNGEVDMATANYSNPAEDA